MFRTAAGIGILIVIVGCGAHTSSMLDQLQTKGAPDPLEKTQLSDLGILRYAHELLDKYGVRSLNNETIATGGAITVAALSSAALGVSANGASRGVMSGLVAGGNFVLQVLGIIDPSARTNAFSEGGGLILDAEGEYLIALTKKRIYHIPTDRVTPAGAILLSKVNAAVKSVSRSMVGLMPRFSDLQKLQPVDPNSLGDDDVP